MHSATTPTPVRRLVRQTLLALAIGLTWLALSGTAAHAGPLEAAGAASGSAAVDVVLRLPVTDNPPEAVVPGGIVQAAPEAEVPVPASPALAADQSVNPAVRALPSAPPTPPAAAAPDPAATTPPAPPAPALPDPAATTPPAPPAPALPDPTATTPPAPPAPAPAPAPAALPNPSFPAPNPSAGTSRPPAVDDVQAVPGPKPSTIQPGTASLPLATQSGTNELGPVTETRPVEPAPAALTRPMEAPTPGEHAVADPGLACATETAGLRQRVMPQSVGHVSAQTLYVPRLILPQPLIASGQVPSAGTPGDSVPADPTPSHEGDPAAPDTGHRGPSPWRGGTGGPGPEAALPTPGSGAGSGSVTSGPLSTLAWLPSAQFFIPLLGADRTSGPLRHVSSTDSADPGSSPE